MTAIQPIRIGSSAASDVFATLLEHHTGQQLGANRSWRIDTALKPLLRDLEFESLDKLAAEVSTRPDARLSDAIVDALLNQETSFFRDAGVLETVADAAEAMVKGHQNRRLRVWCAGCSTGQEPLSLAMLFAERAARTGMHAPEIVATDVSNAAITRARAGRYTQFEAQRGLPIRRLMSWFDSDGNDWSVNRELLQRVRYRRHNLTADPPPLGRFDIVLCRNVLFYFAPDVRRRVFATLAEAVRPGGLLLLGAGETVIGQTDLFVPSAEWRGFYEPGPSAQARPFHG